MTDAIGFTMQSIYACYILWNLSSVTTPQTSIVGLFGQVAHKGGLVQVQLDSDSCTKINTNLIHHLLQEAAFDSHSLSFKAGMTAFLS